MLPKLAILNVFHQCSIENAMRRFTILAAITIGVLIGAHHGTTQEPDLLPDIPRGDITIQPQVFVAGLPVAEEFVTEVFTQRVGPTDLVALPDGSGRIVVTTYGGTVFSLDRWGNVHPTPFLDLANVASPSHSANFEIGDAHGLTTLAFHPDFAHREKPGFGKFYTVEPETDGTAPPDFFESVVITNVNHDEVLYEYSMPDPSAAVCGTECVATKRELLRVSQPGWHHNLGDLAFDQAKLLYISSGDGGLGRVSENAQLLDNIFGKILRIDPLGTDSASGTYGIPADNPFLDGPGGNVDEIYAYGLRNPYRIDFDDATGDLFASETGELSIESVNRIAYGGNHGWNKKEGRFLYDRQTKQVTVDEDLDGNGIGDFADAEGFIEPVFQYDRGDGRAVIGGILYRGSDIVGLNGAYVFAEFDGPRRNRGRLFYGRAETNQAFEFAQVEDSVLLPSAIHSVNEDLEDNLYVLGIYRSGDDYDGVVLRIKPSPLIADFNDDGLVDCGDAGRLHAAITSGEHEGRFDLNADQLVDHTDLEMFLARAADARDFARRIPAGDANLDGVVDAADLNILGSHWQSDTATSWCEGDFDVDGDVDVGDLNALGLNWQLDVSAPAASATLTIPEPVTASGVLLVGFMMTLSLCRRKRALNAHEMSSAR